MSDTKVLQPGDLNPSQFENNGTQNAGGVGIKLSGQGGNLLSHRDDGLYYGTVAPPNLQVQYVDAVNGNDGNDGSINSPLKTINFAIARLPQGSLNNMVLLHEQQTHVVDSMCAIAAGVTVTPYGPNTDAIEAVWNTSTTGWSSVAAVEYEPFRPTIQYTYHYTAPALGGTSAASWILSGGISLVVRGMDIKVPNPAGSTGNNDAWCGVIWGNGTFELQDSKVFNGNAGNATWHLVDTHDSNMVVYIRNSDLESNDPKNYVFGIRPLLTAKFEDHVQTTHPSGLTWRGSTKKEVWKASEVGALPPQIVSPNYQTNF